uniref:Uncharacterized protein n=1 Tax=Siphoviridae sp. ct3pR10 TaxID=2826284 RepID=A0A8S5LWT8_9CAUD|nr:MAG TPA: hypothetical protein [Siphoviridae sp. ct3pR10]
MPGRSCRVRPKSLDIADYLHYQEKTRNIF